MHGIPGRKAPAGRPAAGESGSTSVCFFPEVDGKQRRGNTQQDRHKAELQVTYRRHL